MALDEFTPADHIFENEEVLRDSHRPDELLERDEQLSEYQAALKPVIKGTRPKNIFLVGQTGVGKTVGTKLIREQFNKDQQKYDHIDVNFVYLNCKKLSNSYRVAANLVNKFRPEDDQITTTGYPRDMIYNMLYRELRNTDHTHVIIILDEIDSIGNDDGILYELPRCNDNEEVPPEDTYVGVIGISNDFTFRDNLSARVKDSLCEEEIHFPPYDAEELARILEHRAENAFVDDVLDSSVPRLCGALAGQESGSARYALNLLYKAGDLARSEGTPRVSEDHVRRAEPLVKENKIRRELERLPSQSHLTLYAVLALHNKDKLPARSLTIYNAYQTAAEEVVSDVKTQRTIRDRLGALQLKGFLTMTRENRGEGGGRYDLYDFGEIEISMIRDVLANTDRIDELFPNK
ncbi:orc1/cdc6 family replication initiation protein [Natronoglomus mannanivorans]|uniref:ORC1-type DNA replication protein n=1 Tax=Natronoglomus mannanivorans TaxID=2979990 RepID=A0AAP3E4C3_9EURY|nr:orc1/cdc6 family replication initiation protein [Halobacteria archaeon AArc-xg1-1]